MTDMQAWLDQGKTLANQATDGPWFTSPFEHDPVWGAVVTGGVDERDEDLSPCIEAGSRKDVAFIADARTRLPQALAALQAVLDMHKRSFYGSCTSCVQNRYPCPTVRAITDAIGGGDE